MGFENAKGLAALGYDIVMIAKDQSRLSLAQQSLQRHHPNQHFTTYAVDLEDLEATRTTVDLIAQQQSAPDVMILAHGVMSEKMSKTLRTTDAEWRRVMTINLDSVFTLVNGLAPAMVEVHDQAGNLVASNDDWKDTQEAEIRQGGILPLDDLDCGLVITLASGNYTVIVRGYHGATGVGIFEAFRLGRTVLRPSLNSFAGTFVAPGSSTRFTATVVNTANQAVLWSVTGGGVISADGTYTAPATPPTGPVTVTVRAAADPGIFQVFDVTVATPGAASFSSALRLLPNQGTDGNFDPFTGNNTVNGITLMADGGSPLSHYTWYPTTGAVQPLGVILEPATGILKSSGVRNRVTTGLFHVTVSDGSRTANGVVSFVAANGSSDPALLNPLGVAVFSQLNLAAFALVNATANRAYGATLYADIGGGGLAAVLPLTWTLVAGSLPEGLALDAATGVVRGNVLSSAAGRNYSFRVQVRDAAGRLANVVGAGPLYTIRVDP